MDRSENSTSEVEEESQSLTEEKEIETGLLHFRDEMIDFWEKETSTDRKKKFNQNNKYSVIWQKNLILAI